MINYFQWVIGFFEKENKYSVIPDNWLSTTGVGTNTEYWCKWPKKHVTATMIIKRKEPLSNWSTFPVKIIEIFGRYHYYI